MRLRLSKVHFPVTALGPGSRAGIWTQGCGIRCKGCLSRDTWDSEGGADIAIDDLVRWVKGLPEGHLDGVTISGGEPFDQPDALENLLELLHRFRAERDRPLDLLAYSGYGIGRLRKRFASALTLLDAVIVGPYRRDKPTRLVWRGSANQALIPLTELGRERYDMYIRLQPARAPFQVSVDDGVWLIGVPRSGHLPELESMLRRSGVGLRGVSWSA